jgi:hypothetical protein
MDNKHKTAKPPNTGSSPDGQDVLRDQPNRWAAVVHVMIVFAHEWFQRAGTGIEERRRILVS